MMEIRLRELESVIDLFVVVESRTTFRGNPRSLRFPVLMQRLPGAVLNKLVYHVLDDLKGSGAWDREKYQRNMLFEVAVARAGLRPGDVLLVSDCDEIPRPSFIEAMKQCDGVTFPLAMGSALHYYSFSLKPTSKVWSHPRAIVYQEPLPMKSDDRRSATTGFKMFPNASWHCSYCFKHISAIKQKIASFSHSEFDLPEHQDAHHIVHRVRAGLDIFNRTGVLFERDNSGDMPQYVREHPTRFSYMMNRDADDAGFSDIGLQEEALLDVQI